MTLRTTGPSPVVRNVNSGAVAVGVSATREAERASDRDGLSLAMNLFIERVFKSVNVFVCTVYGRPIGHSGCKKRCSKQLSVVDHATNLISI